MPQIKSKTDTKVLVLARDAVSSHGTGCSHNSIQRLRGAVGMEGWQEQFEVQQFSCRTQLDKMNNSSTWSAIVFFIRINFREMK